MELKGKIIPKDLEQTLWAIRDRVKDLVKTYGTLAKWGRPFFFDVKEIAVVVYLNEKFNVSLDELAKLIGVDKTAMYRIVKRIKEEGRASYYDKESNTVKTIALSLQDCISMVEEMLQAKAKASIVDVTQSKIIQDFLSKPIRKRAVIAGHDVYLSDEDKAKIVRVVQRIMNYMKEKGIQPLNPDFWSEDQVLQTLEKMVNDGVITQEQKRYFMIRIRSIPAWRNWFEGLMGAATKFAKPVERVIFYKDYIKVKEAWKQGKLSEQEFLVFALHLATRAREGWESGTTLEDAKSSLCGLKWENISWRGDFRDESITIKIYEHKTNKWWYCDPSWLDIEIAQLLKKYAKEKGSIIASITGLKSIKDFESWYKKVLKKISQLLNLPFTLTPHDIRRSGLSILAELGVPLEIACSDRLALGVGWEDLKTAYVYYLRFSKTTKERVLREIEAAKATISKATISR